MVAVLGKFSATGRDQRAGKKFSLRKIFLQVRRHRCGRESLRHNRHHGIRVLAGDVNAAVIAQLDVERMHHGRDSLGVCEHFDKAERVAMPAVPRNVAVPAPRVRDVEVPADQGKSPRDVQRVRLR